MGVFALLCVCSGGLSFSRLCVFFWYGNWIRARALFLRFYFAGLCCGDLWIFTYLIVLFLVRGGVGGEYGVSYSS